MAFVSASSLILVAGSSFSNQSGPQALFVNGAKEGVNVSHPKKAS